MRVRKKPVEVEAIQYDGTPENMKEIFEFVGANVHVGYSGRMIIRTLEGEMRVNVNDWVIRGVKGEFYPCKPDIFEQTYERVDA